MKKIGFIGVGNMGGPMAVNLLKAGYEVKAFDVIPESLDKVAAEGAKASSNLADVVDGVDIVISMLPGEKHVKDVYLDALKGKIAKGSLVLDCSTIDVAAAQEVADSLKSEGLFPVDAPVSGGIMGAKNATLTFMAGGSKEAFDMAMPFFEKMGKTIVHAGGNGMGQAAKVCNNMMLGIQMISVCEGFNLADKLGLDRQKLFDISSTASGQCWSLTTYCPVPGPVPASPANNDYNPGFMAKLMLKDLRLSQSAAKAFNCPTPLGKAATDLYTEYSEKQEQGDKDFSGIINYLRELS